MRIKLETKNQFFLHRSAAPYVKILFIFLVFTIGCLSLLRGKYNASFFIGLSALWILVILYLTMEACYQVFLIDGVLVQKAWMMKKIEINVIDIYGIRLESGISKIGRVQRPYSRVSIYGNEVRGGCAFIDISLKHFLGKDIASLLALIKSNRPDIKLSDGLSKIH